MKRGYEMGMQSMSHLNRNAARYMLTYGAHAATDVTGFGILGHAVNLAGNQNADVRYCYHVTCMCDSDGLALRFILFR